MRDPDLAPQTGTTWQYRYFAFGDELRQQTDAKGQQVTLTNDVLGRTTARAEPEGTTNFYFDAAGKPKGALDRIEGPGLNKYFYYDSLTRHYKTTTQVTGTGLGNGSYDVTRGFGIGDRVETITYPTSTAYLSGLQVRYDFNANGYLYRVKNESSGAAYWTLDAVTAEGQLQQATFGNGLVTQNLYQATSGNLDEIRTGPSAGSTTVQNFHFDFSLIGNLAYRADVNAGVGERLTAAGAYDAQNRLTSVQRVAHTADHTSGAVQATTNFTYNALGNLLTKGGIAGTYDYSVTPQTSCPSGYTTTPGPHAVRRTGTTGAFREMCYDRNGNQTRSWNFFQNRYRTTAWTSFNLPASITENSTAITFSYGPDRQRFRQVNGFNSQTTIYIEGLFDREVTSTASNAVHYILANGQAVATFSSSSAGVTSTRYLHRDHVGSVTHVTNESAALVQTLAYDAWGARRNPSNWTDYTTQPPAATLRRPQYTGHEGHEDVAIVNMNGRIYDPKLGRVLSPDPLVQFAGDAQNYNRYSYALNNPLLYTDPSGFMAERLCFLASGSQPKSR